MIRIAHVSYDLSAPLDLSSQTFIMSVGLCGRCLRRHGLDLKNERSKDLKLDVFLIKVNNSPVINFIE